MVGGINAEEFSNLEDMFHYNKDKELIREIRKKVEEHERNKDEEKKQRPFRREGKVEQSVRAVVYLAHFNYNCR